MLHDGEIVRRLHYGGELTIEPTPDDLQIQPASVDLRLGEHIIVDPATEQRTSIGESMTLLPGDFVLTETFEAVGLPDDVVGFLTGRSTLGRKGIIVHATAGLVDPGWAGRDADGDVVPRKLTMEVAHLGKRPVTLTPGQRVCQMYFLPLTGSSSGYDGQYGNEDAVEAPGEL